MTASVRLLWRLAVLLAACLTVLLPASKASAAEDPSIAHVEASDDGLRVLVSVPAGTDVDLAGVTMSLDGEQLDAEAAAAGSETMVERTAILVIDTSDSMKKEGRIDAAKDAAMAFLDAVPADVRVGIVTFAREVTTALEPTTDRGEARAVVSGLQLAPGTALYDGVLSGVDVAGSDGQRSLLVLSDGKDTGKGATLDEVTSTVGEANTLVDVVSLGGTDIDLGALEDLAGAGSGRVIEASGSQLADAFAAEADVLASQVLVTAALPAGFEESEATVEVTLPTDSGELVAAALAPIQDASAPEISAPAAPKPVDAGWNAPDWVLWVGIGVFAVGLFAAALLLVPAPPAPMTIAERVTAYSRATSPGEEADPKPASEPMLDQAKAAAAGVLQRNEGLEEKLASRLTAAGSQLKPSEWFLLQIGVVIAAALLGLVVGRGNLIVALLCVPVGFLVPRIYLSVKTSRRRKAFNSNLPETLQLMSGALAAGLSLAQSVDTVVREGPEPIASEFKRVLVETRVGVPLEDAFEGVAARFGSKDFAWVVMAIRIQRYVGGNLGELLNTVSDTMRERQYLRRQVASLAAEGKYSAYILSAMPPGFLAFQMVTNPDYMSVMFSHRLGIAMMVGAVIWLSIGIFWMSRLVKVEV